MPTQEKRRLSTDALKLIAIAAMLLDHIPYLSDGMGTYYQFPVILAHLLGRIAAPIFFYFLAVGYRRTRDANRYAVRLFFFACVSYIPFIWYFHGGFPNGENFYHLNVMFTMFFGLLALRAWHELRNPALKAGAIALCLLAGSFADYGIFGVAFIFAFDLFREDKTKMAAAYALIVSQSVYHNVLVNAQYYDRANLAAFLASPGLPGYALVLLAQMIPLVFILRHGDAEERRADGRNPLKKWFFYAFYPLHIAALLLLRLFAL
jgi:hypothetical protein